MKVIVSFSGPVLCTQERRLIVLAPLGISTTSTDRLFHSALPSKNRPFSCFLRRDVSINVRLTCMQHGVRTYGRGLLTSAPLHASAQMG